MEKENVRPSGASMTHPAPSSADVIEGIREALAPHVLCKMDEELLRKQRDRLGGMSEVWTESAMQYSVEGDDAGDRAMMKLAKIFIIAENAITRVIKEAEALRALPDSKPDEARDG